MKIAPKAVRYWRLCAVYGALALSGCVTTKYVTRSCLTQSQFEQLKAEAPPKIRAQLNGQADHDVKILAANLVRRQAYESLLLDTLKVCAQ